MVDREHDLGQGEAAQDFEIPHQRQQRTRESAPRRTGLTDEELLKFFPKGNYNFERIPLDVIGQGIEEIGIHRTGERIEAYELDTDGKRKALRGVLTGYQGVFGRENHGERITVDIVGILVGDEMSTELYTDMPGMNVRKWAQAVADKGIPISVATNRRTGATVLASRTPAGLLSDITNLQVQLNRFSFMTSRTLHRARAVAQHVKSNFKAERPPDQPGRVKVKGQ